MEIKIFHGCGKKVKKFMVPFYCHRDQYMSYQRKRVGEVDDDRLKFEISTILSREVIFWHINLVYDEERFEDPALCCFLSLNCITIILHMLPIIYMSLSSTSFPFSVHVYSRMSKLRGKNLAIT